MTTRAKPQVERPMPYVRDSFWRGREFTSLQQMQAEAVRWSAPVAGQRSCRLLEGAAPAVIFAAVEAEALQPLPKAPFVLAEWSRGKVGPDIHVKVGQCLHSVPWKYIGKSVDARSTYSMVQFFLDSELIKTPVRKPRGKQTDLADYPPVMWNQSRGCQAVSSASFSSSSSTCLAQVVAGCSLMVTFRAA